MSGLALVSAIWDQKLGLSFCFNVETLIFFLMQGLSNLGKRILVSNFPFFSFLSLSLSLLAPYEVLGHLVTTLRLKSTSTMVSSFFKFHIQQSNRLHTIEKTLDSDECAAEHL